MVKGSTSKAIGCGCSCSLPHGASFLLGIHSMSELANQPAYPSTTTTIVRPLQHDASHSLADTITPPHHYTMVHKVLFWSGLGNALNSSAHRQSSLLTTVHLPRHRRTTMAARH